VGSAADPVDPLGERVGSADGPVEAVNQPGAPPAGAVASADEPVGERNEPGAAVARAVAPPPGRVVSLDDPVAPPVDTVAPPNRRVAAVNGRVAPPNEPALPPNRSFASVFPENRGKTGDNQLGTRCRSRAQTTTPGAVVGRDSVEPCPYPFRLGSTESRPTFAPSGTHDVQSVPHGGARRSALPPVLRVCYNNGAEDLQAVNTASGLFTPALRALAVVCILAVAVPSARAQFVADGATNVLDNVTNIIAGDVTVGTNGAFTLLILTNNALLTNSECGLIGRNTGANSNLVQVTGNNTRWLMTSNLYVGSNGAFNNLLISNGGRVEDLACYVGYTLGADSNQAVVTGAGSLWTNKNWIVLGWYGSANMVTVTNHGKVANLGTYLGAHSNANCNQVIIGGAGAFWVDSGYLVVAYYGSSNIVRIIDGGQMTNLQVWVGYGVNANNNQVIVEGPGSTWMAQIGPFIGYFGVSNSVVITNGGRLDSNGGSIGSESNAIGNQVIISGNDSSWRSRGVVNVGAFGSFNLLCLTNGGDLTASRVWVGSYAGASGNLLTVGGGSLNATNFFRNSELDVRRGAIVFNGGSITVDRMWLTNSESDITFNAGTLCVHSISVSNGACFTVGDGVSLSSFRMIGAASNIHSFANGLLINPNATLAGNGTIVGNVTNFGTLDVGSSTRAINVQGGVQFQPSGTAIFELGGPTPTNGYDQLTVTSNVQFGGTLDLRLTNGFLPGPGDTFTLVKFATSFGIFNGVSNGQRINFFNGKASFFVNYDNNLVLSAVQYRDMDGDGQGDLQEEAAGTDPNDPASVLAVTSITKSGNVVVQFRSVAGKTYRIEHSAGVGPWNIATTNVPATGTNTTWIDDGSLTGGLPTTNRFYRVGLQ
jgi:T5SS/PEP-CTERM-associated repeat protein